MALWSGERGAACAQCQRWEELPPSHGHYASAPAWATLCLIGGIPMSQWLEWHTVGLWWRHGCPVDHSPSAPSECRIVRWVKCLHLMSYKYYFCPFKTISPRLGSHMENSCAWLYDRRQEQALMVEKATGIWTGLTGLWRVREQLQSALISVCCLWNII